MNQKQRQIWSSWRRILKNVESMIVQVNYLCQTIAQQMPRPFPFARRHWPTDVYQQHCADLRPSRFASRHLPTILCQRRCTDPRT